jgi:hypothetical protein
MVGYTSSSNCASWCCDKELPCRCAGMSVKRGEQLVDRIRSTSPTRCGPTVTRRSPLPGCTSNSCRSTPRQVSPGSTGTRARPPSRRVVRRCGRRHRLRLAARRSSQVKGQGQSGLRSTAGRAERPLRRHVRQRHRRGPRLQEARPSLLYAQWATTKKNQARMLAAGAASPARASSYSDPEAKASMTVPQE